MPQGSSAVKPTKSLYLFLWRKPCDICCKHNWNSHSFFYTWSDFTDIGPLQSAWINPQTKCDRSDRTVKGLQSALPKTQSSQKPPVSAMLMLFSTLYSTFRTRRLYWWTRHSCQSWRVSKADVLLTSASSLGTTTHMSMECASVIHPAVATSWPSSWNITCWRLMTTLIQCSAAHRIENRCQVALAIKLKFFCSGLELLKNNLPLESGV